MFLKKLKNKTKQNKNKQNKTKQNKQTNKQTKKQQQHPPPPKKNKNKKTKNKKRKKKNTTAQKPYHILEPTANIKFSCKLYLVVIYMFLSWNFVYDGHGELAMNE